MGKPFYPSLYQVNTRVWLTELSQTMGRPATLDDIPDRDLDRLAEIGFDWVWFLSVWQTGEAGKHISRRNPEWRDEFKQTLPDLREDDIVGSGFAVAGYKVHTEFGGDSALQRLRDRLRRRGLRLMLDFVPNHTALDHPWVDLHPDYYVQGSELALQQQPKNYIRVRNKQGVVIFAYGRDPYFPGWPDTLQLNYGNPSTQEAMIAELLKVADQCDGVRCDMAMLLLPDVFERTWGIRCKPFWAEATRRVRQQFADFAFMAEVYWDLEWTLQQLGFDFTYDKRLYDRLREGYARSVREHFHAGLDYQNKLARFLENHDEPRAAATFPPSVHRAAAIVTYLSPGLRFFHQGQFLGCHKRISPHLGRAPKEPVDEQLQRFYERLLGLLRQPIVRDGKWQLLDCRAAWQGNWTSDCFIAFLWESPDAKRLIVATNYSDHPSQCYVNLPLGDLVGKKWKLTDQLEEVVYERDGNDLQSRGLYLDMTPWGSSVFALIPI